MGGAAGFWSQIEVQLYSVSRLISWCIGPSSGAGLVGRGVALLRWRWSSARGKRSHTPKGLTLASERGAIQRHILLWGKVRNWKVSAGSWVIGTCYYCVPPPPSNNLFIAIPLLQISLHSHKARFFKKYMHSYSCQVWIPTFFIFHKEKGWFLWYPGIFPHCWSESRLPVRRRAVSLPYLDGDVILPLIQNLAGS